MTGRQRSNEPDAKRRAAREKLASLRRALTDAEAVLTRAAQEMGRAGRPLMPRASPRRQPLPADVQAATRAVSDYFSRVVDLMGEEGNRLSEQVTALTEAVQRLERRLDELPKLSAPSPPTPPPAEAPPTKAPAAETPPAEPPPVEAPPPAPPARPSIVESPVEQEGAPAEPQFAAGGEGIQLLISSVPGFQGLMEVQRALTHMPAVEGASVERYLDGEARIVLLLREPLTARRIVDGLTEYIGEALSIEEARPEALRLHLRFSGET
jgi:hypothetical protein